MRQNGTVVEGEAQPTLVKEASAPYLAGHETATENADKEANSEELTLGVNSSGQEGRDSTL